MREAMEGMLLSHFFDVDGGDEEEEVAIRDGFTSLLLHREKETVRTGKGERIRAWGR